MGVKGFKLSKKQRLIVTICISLTFFLLELIFGFRTGSLALIADAFHYLNDLVGFSVALAAIVVSERSKTPRALSYGWQRGQILGGFFNGVFLLALGISIALQSIERFVELRHVEDPMAVLILGGVGLFLNVITLLFLHDHGHGHGHAHDHGSGQSQENAKAISLSTPSDNESATRHHEHRHVTLDLVGPGHDLGMLGVILHVVGDAINNMGVMVAAVVIWKAESEARFYADAAVSLFIAVMIFVTALPLVKYSGSILLQTAPPGVDLEDVKHDLEKIPGIDSVHELHVWRLNERKAIASAHIVVSNDSIPAFIETARHINECLHAYGVHSVALQPELPLGNRGSGPVPVASQKPFSSSALTLEDEEARMGTYGLTNECQLVCAKVCEELMCCEVKQQAVD